jgi:glycosyltransferase involved in cell wall biosynthesis
LSADPAIRVAFELTGLELDVAGSSRAIRGVRDALALRQDVELVDMAHSAPPPLAASRIGRGLHRELLYMPLRLPRLAARRGAQLLHCPVGVGPVRSRLPLVITVNDVMALEHPEWFTRANALQQRLVLPRAVRAAARVLTPSRYTQERLVEICKADPGRVEVAPYGVDAAFGPGPASGDLLERLGVTGPYVLTVGTLQPRKNLQLALRAFERVAAAGAPHSLVVVGARGWRDEPLLEALQASPAGRRVQLLGRVSDEELVELYRGADCLLFPSLYEGFGFPVLEAMACGTPVLCARSTSLPELAGDAAELADPDDLDAFGSALADLLASSSRRDELEAAGLIRAREFSWGRCAELTVAAYRRALES